MKQLIIGIAMFLAVFGIVYAAIKFARYQERTKYELVSHYQSKIDSLDNEYYERFRWHNEKPMRIDTTLIEQDSILAKIYYYKHKIRTLLEEK